MSRDFNCRFEDDFIADYFKKRYEMNKLKNEVDITSKKIKDSLLTNGMYYAATKNYTINVHPQHKANDKFILLLKENNLANYIEEFCTVSIVDDITRNLNLNPEEYKEVRCHVLKINKKS